METICKVKFIAPMRTIELKNPSFDGKNSILVRDVILTLPGEQEIVAEARGNFAQRLDDFAGQDCLCWAKLSFRCSSWTANDGATKYSQYVNLEKLDVL